MTVMCIKKSCYEWPTFDDPLCSVHAIIKEPFCVVISQRRRLAIDAVLLVRPHRSQRAARHARPVINKNDSDAE